MQTTGLGTSLTGIFPTNPGHLRLCQIDAVPRRDKETRDEKAVQEIVLCTLVKCQ